MTHVCRPLDPEITCLCGAGVADLLGLERMSMKQGEESGDSTQIDGQISLPFILDTICQCGCIKGLGWRCRGAYPVPCSCSSVRAPKLTEARKCLSANLLCRSQCLTNEGALLQPCAVWHALPHAHRRGRRKRRAWQPFVLPDKLPDPSAGRGGGVVVIAAWTMPAAE